MDQVHMKTRTLLFGLLVAAAAFAQSTMVSATGSNNNGGFTGSATFRPQSFAPRPVTGAAYSGEEVNETVQTLSDGTHITSKNVARRIWRDSQGRTCSERPLFPHSNDGGDPFLMSIIEITDPVAGFQYVLDPQNKIAHRTALQTFDSQARVSMTRSGVMGGVISATPAGVPAPPPPPPPPGAVMQSAAIATSMGSGGGFGVGGGFVGAGPAPSGMPRPDIKSENLGTKTIDGVLAEGHRTTMTYATGSMGNDQPFSVVMENWMSPELKTQILSVNHDPRSGDRTFKIANLSRNEPDAVLFMVPADYQIVDEKDSFTIQYKK
jgi:hypothetical protein